MKTYTITAEQELKEIERIENATPEKTVEIMRRWTNGTNELANKLGELLINDEVRIFNKGAMFTITLEK